MLGAQPSGFMRPTKEERLGNTKGRKRMNLIKHRPGPRIAIAALTILAVCPASVWAEDGTSARAWEQMMSRGTLLGIQLATRHRFQEGKLSKPYLDCIEAIDPDAFSDVYRHVMERLLTADEIQFTEAFWRSAVGARLAELAEWAQYQDLGVQPPHIPKSLTAQEQAAADVNNRSVAAQKLYSWATTLNGRMEPEAEARVRSLIVGCRTKTR
jgi:hypothetical protein